MRAGKRDEIIVSRHSATLPQQRALAAYKARLIAGVGRSNASGVAMWEVSCGDERRGPRQALPASSGA